MWAVRFSNPPAGLPTQATLRLQQHAEFTESLAGLVSRELGAAAGSPAISITGTWNGELIEGSCGKQFQGSWKDTSRSAADNAPDVPFTLTKLP